MEPTSTPNQAQTRPCNSACSTTFYDSGEVSGDGHLWSTASTTSDYNEKTWPIGYRSNERTYDSGGSVAEETSTRARESLTLTIPLPGFLWDNLAAAA